MPRAIEEIKNLPLPSLDLFKVIYYFVPWEVTIKPPGEYVGSFSKHETSKSK